MNKRRSFFELVPAGTWVGVILLIGLAFVDALRPLVAVVALLTLLYTLFRSYEHIVETEERAAARTPLTTVQNEPQGQTYELGFQEVLRAIPDPAMIVSGFEQDDIAGRWIVFANTVAQTTFRIPDEGGLLVSSIRNPEVLECVDEALFGRIGRSMTFDTTGGARDQYWRAFASPLPLESGAHKLALLVIRDETDIRRMERMRADFLANASHELRTPLASLTGFIETLRGHAKDDIDVRDKFLNIMAAQADRMGRLISDLLSLSRIEMNEHVPPSGETDLALVVGDVVDSLTLIAEEKQVRLRVDAPKPGLYPIIGDRDQILQVVQNLVDNALKYAPTGSDITIEVCHDRTLEQATAPGDKGAGDKQAPARLILLRPDRNVHDYYAMVRVRDNGPGIRREFLPRLAERFYRVEGQKSGDRLGTGLGLAIVKHIINRHRGGLTVDSVSATSGGNDLAIMEHASSERPADSTKVAALPAASVQTFTAFSAYFPQKGAYGVTAEGPRLAVTDGVATPSPAPLKDAG